jgi:hypothetical protein
VGEVRRVREPHVVISSEFFADASQAAIRQAVHDLDPERIHVLVTLRPLARILASQWQQYVQSGMRTGYQNWLEAMLGDERTTITPTFWRRHRHDQLIRRWADALGPSRVTAIVLDRTDRRFVLRAMERLLGLPAETLPLIRDARNRSLTLAEVETLRAFNIAFRDANLSPALLSRVVQWGAARYIKAWPPASDEGRICTPTWAAERASQIAHEMVASIAESGVNVIGDLDGLLAGPDPVADKPPAAEISPEIAARVAMGVLAAAGVAPLPSDGTSPTGWRGPEPLALSQMTTVEVLAALPPRIARLGIRGWRGLRTRMRSMTGQGVPSADEEETADA